MGYDVALVDEHGDPVDVEPHQAGSNIAIGGSCDADCTVTYNYGAHFCEALGKRGLRKLDGMTGAESIQLLEAAVATLGTEFSGDYWEATPGNAGVMLAVLLGWARQQPEAVWQIRG